MTHYMIIGLGGNNVEVPTLLFPDKETAKAYLEYNLGVPVIGDGAKVPVRFFDPDHEELTDEDLEADVDPRWGKFFTHYYGGCGECFGFVIRPVEYGVPITGFDLD